MSDEAIELAAQLVRIPSVNPMGREVEGPNWREAKLTAFLVDRLRGGPCRVDVQEVEPERSNVFVTLPSASPPGADGACSSRNQVPARKLRAVPCPIHSSRPASSACAISRSWRAASSAFA